MIPTALVPRGARQRRRTADGRAGARHVRVLTGYSNQGAQTGYSIKGTHSSGETPWALAAVFVGYWWAVLGSASSAHSEYGSTYRVLTGYSKGTLRYGGLTHGVLLGCPHAGEFSPAAAVRSDARARAATGRVLTGYSQGTDRVLKGTHEGGTHTVLRIPPRTRIFFGSLWQSV